MEKKWSLGNKLTAGGLFLAVVAIIVGLLTPEVRQFFHLEKRPEVSPATTSQTSPQSTPQSQSSEPPKQEPLKATKQTIQKTTTRVTGDNNVSGNNVAGNNNILGNNNTVYTAPPVSKPITPLADIRIASQKQVASADSHLPFGLEVVLVTDKDVSPTALTIRFSGEVGKLYGHPPGQIYTKAQGGIMVSSPHTVLIQWETPAFSVEEPVVLTVYSKTYVQAEKVESVPFNFPYAGQLSSTLPIPNN